MPLTNFSFARHLSFIAADAAKWAADVLTLPEDIHEPTPADVVGRYLEHTQRRLALGIIYLTPVTISGRFPVRIKG